MKIKGTYIYFIILILIMLIIIMYMYLNDNKENLGILDGVDCHKKLMVEMNDVTNFVSKNKVDPILIQKINNLAENINCINNSISDTDNNLNLLGTNLKTSIFDYYSNNENIINQI